MAKGKTLAVNRRARYDYEITEQLEVGIVLKATEIKSLRDNRVNISGAYAYPFNGELWIHNLHISPYPFAKNDNYDPTRTRKLLLRKAELKKFSEAAGQKGLTLVPIRVYLSGHFAKVELGIGRGKSRHDKRRTIIDRDRQREARDAERRKF